MIKPEPFDYQYKACDFILKNGSSYLMLDCGRAKTRAVLMAIQKLVKRFPKTTTLVFAPKYPALDTWPEQIALWAPELTYVVMHGKSKDHYCSTANSKNIVIVPYSSLSWLHSKMYKRQFPLTGKYHIVLDEASFVKNPESRRTQMLMEMSPIFSPYVILMSGTPAPQGLMDLWSQYYLLDKGRRLHSSFYQFRSRYYDYSGPPFFTSTLREGAEEKIYDKIADITFRLNEDDYDDMPELMLNDIKLTLPPKLCKQYNALEEDFMLEFPNGAALASTTAALGNKLRQFLQGGIYYEDVQADGAVVKRWKALHKLKAQALKDLLEQSNKQPVLAAIQFKWEYDIVCKVLGYEVPVIFSKTPTAEAQSYIRQWNRQELPLLLAHPASIGHGVNLQTGGHILVWLAMPWSLEHYYQFYKRLHRTGQQAKSVIMHRIVFRGTKDMVVADSLRLKDITQQDLYDALTSRSTSNS